MATLIQTLQQALTGKDPYLSNETKRVVLKEALQALVLDFVYNHRTYRALNFYGGTCLHVIYGLNRLSEDIDLDNSQGIEVGNIPDDLSDFVTSRLGYRDATVKSQQSKSGIMRITLRFPVLFDLGLSTNQDEMLHLKLEISHHPQIAVIKHTPVMHYGRSFVPSHFSLETMMTGKMLACLERSFHVGSSGTLIKGRDYYDLLWFMQKQVQPLERKLALEGTQAYTVASAMQVLQGKVNQIKAKDLELDLLSLFEERTYIEAWIAAFHENFSTFVEYYL